MKTTLHHYVQVYGAAFAIRFAALMLLWAILTEVSGYQLWFGLAITVLATVASLTLAPPLGHRLSVIAVLRLLPFFLSQALIGGVDVGRRALRRRALQPVFIEYPLELTSVPSRLCFTCMISLLPGTVACDLRGDVLHIHVLDRSMRVQPVLKQLEAYTAALFRTPTDV